MRRALQSWLLVAIASVVACDPAPEAAAIDDLVDPAAPPTDEPGEESSDGDAAVDDSDAVTDCGSLTVCGVHCADLSSDPNNCGACGVSCVVAHGEGGCAQGVCTLAACDEGYGDCDGVPDNGCETQSGCVPGSACETTCGSTGQTSCADACAPTCLPVVETCNTVDDDCSGACDDGALPGCRQGVHRSNSPTQGHFYTLDPQEAASSDFSVEAFDFYFTYVDAIDGLAPLFRCLRPNGRRFYTQSAACENAGTPEGHLGYVAPDERCGAIPLYRLYLPSQDRHFYTVSAAERDSAVASGWTFEFVVAHVWASL